MDFPFFGITFQLDVGLFRVFAAAIVRELIFYTSNGFFLHRAAVTQQTSRQAAVRSVRSATKQDSLNWSLRRLKIESKNDSSVLLNLLVHAAPLCVFRDDSRHSQHRRVANLHIFHHRARPDISRPSDDLSICFIHFFPIGGSLGHVTPSEKFFFPSLSSF